MAAEAAAQAATAANPMAVDTMSLTWSKRTSSANPGQAPKGGLEAASAADTAHALALGHPNLARRSPLACWVCGATQTHKERRNMSYRPESLSPPRMLLAETAFAQAPSPQRMRMMLAGEADAENPPPPRMLQTHPPGQRHSPPMSPPLPRIQGAEEFAFAPASRMWEAWHPPYPSHALSPALSHCDKILLQNTALPCALPSLCSCLAATSVSLCSASCCSAISPLSTSTSASRERASVRSGSGNPCECLGHNGQNSPPLRMLQHLAQTSPLPRMMQSFGQTSPLPRMMQEASSRSARKCQATSSVTLYFACWHPYAPPLRAPSWVTLIVACWHPCAPPSCRAPCSVGAAFCASATHLAAVLCRVSQLTPLASASSFFAPKPRRSTTAERGGSVTTERGMGSVTTVGAPLSPRLKSVISFVIVLITCLANEW